MIDHAEHELAPSPQLVIRAIELAGKAMAIDLRTERITSEGVLGHYVEIHFKDLHNPKRLATLFYSGEDLSTLNFTSDEGSQLYVRALKLLGDLRNRRVVGYVTV